MHIHRAGQTHTHTNTHVHTHIHTRTHPHTYAETPNKHVCVYVELKVSSLDITLAVSSLVFINI